MRLVMEHDMADQEISLFKPGRGSYSKISIRCSRALRTGVSLASVHCSSKGKIDRII
jgi:hypothetical protein